jgi:hypothetical protein
MGGLASAGPCKAAQHALDLADRHRLAGRGMQRDFGGLKQIVGMKAGGEPFEPHCRDIPVAITARPLEQIKLAVGAFQKGSTQLAHQRGIIAGRCREGRIEGSVIKGHGQRHSRNWVKAGFIPIPAVV